MIYACANLVEVQTVRNFTFSGTFTLISMFQTSVMMMMPMMMPHEGLSLVLDNR